MNDEMRVCYIALKYNRIRWIAYWANKDIILSNNAGFNWIHECIGKSLKIANFNILCEKTNIVVRFINKYFYWGN